MTDTGIFKYVWRLNSVLILALAVLFIILASNELLDGMNRDRREARPSAEQDSTLQLSQSILVDNGRFYLLALSPGGRKRGEGLWQNEAIRNFLVIDAETNSHFWLLPDTTNAIMKWNEITKDVDCGFESVALELITIPLDTNGDGMRNFRDRAVHLISASPEFEPRDLVGEPVDFFECEENDGRLFCEFRTNRGLETAIFALDANMTELARSVLPELPEPAGGKGQPNRDE